MTLPPALSRPLRRLLEQLDAAIQRADEALLFLADHARPPRSGLRLQFGKRAAHRPRPPPAPVRTGTASSCRGTAGRSAPPGAGCCAARSRAPRCSAPRPSVSANVSVRMWSAITRYAVSFRSSSLPVYGRRSGHLLDRLEDRREHVGVVVARLALQHRRDALEAHAGIDVLRRQRRQLPVRAAVELDEDEVPDLDHVRRARVDELAAASCPACGRCGSRCRGRTGRSRPSPRSCPSCCPSGCATGRCRSTVRHSSAASSSGARPCFGSPSKTVACSRLLSSPHTFVSSSHAQRDRFLLEVIAERPVAEHLEEGVVVGVLADVVEVVVLAAGADALLRVRPPACTAGVPVPRKTSLNWFMPALVNSSVGSSCGTTLAGRHERVAVLLARRSR